MDKSEFFDTLHETRRRWECLMQNVPGEERDARGLVGLWSAQDLLAHIMSYEEYTLDRLKELQLGRQYRPAETLAELQAFQDSFGYPDFGSPLIDDDTPNEWVLQKYRPWPYGQVDRRELLIYAALVQLAGQLPDDGSADELFDWIADNTFEHYRHHSADLIAALGDSSCE